MSNEKPIRSPRNTARDAAENPAGMLLGAMAQGSEAHITGMEADGQRQLVNSDVLPTVGSNDPAWAKMGVIFGDQVPGDQLFRQVTLPAGWTKRGTDHAMHSELLDAKGRVRARMFYKAAFYDRRATIHVAHRFEATYEPEGGWNNPDAYAMPREERRFVAIVKDGGVEIWRSPTAYTATGPMPTSADLPAVWEAYKDGADVARAAAVQHLVDAGFPDWTDATAYWD